MELKERYSILAICLLLCFDLLVIIAMHNPLDWLWYISFMPLLAVLYLWYDGKSKGLELKPKSKVVSNLLANVISPRMLSAFYLLFFVLHIGWLTDASLNLFLAKAYTDWGEILISLVCGALGMFFLILFFPSSSGKGGQDKLFISGISTPFVKNLPKDEEKYNDLNLLPLVRILQLSSDEINDNSCMCILKTDALDQKSCLDGINHVYELLKIVTGKDNIIHIVEDVFDSTSPFSDKQVERMMKYLIFSIAQREFPDKKWLLKQEDEKENDWKNRLEGKIKFTVPCDYNDFTNCYDALDKAIKEENIENKAFYFNMSPGTGLISGLMTLFAIDPSRCLYYYSQKKDIPNDQKLIKIDKDREAVKKILTDALG